MCRNVFDLLYKKIKVFLKLLFPTALLDQSGSIKEAISSEPYAETIVENQFFELEADKATVLQN